MNDKFLTIREAADQLNVNPRTINRWIHKGKLNAVKLPGRAGGEFRISPSELDHLLGDSPEGVSAISAEDESVHAVLEQIWEQIQSAIYVSGRGYEVYINVQTYNDLKRLMQE